MADVVVVPVDVKVKAGATFRMVEVGEAVDQGDVGYLNTTNRDYRKAKASGTEEEANAEGFFVTRAGGDGESALFVTLGGVDLGVDISQDFYVLSANAGKICPRSDLVSTNYITRIGLGTAARNLDVDIDATGVTVA